jgi:hypothetical protein
MTTQFDSIYSGLTALPGSKLPRQKNAWKLILIKSLAEGNRIKDCSFWIRLEIIG